MILAVHAAMTNSGDDDEIINRKRMALAARETAMETLRVISEVNLVTGHNADMAFR